MQFKSLLFSIFAAAAAADDFSTPAPGGSSSSSNLALNPIYPIGSTVNITWSSNLKRISLILWQNGNDALETLQNNVTNTNSYNWNVGTNKHWQSQTANNGNVFFLQIFQPGQTGPAFGSRLFNLSAPTTTSTSASATSSATKSPSASTSNTATATATLTGSAGATSSDSSSSSSSNSTALGVGLGVGIGVPLLAGVAALVWFLRRRKSRQDVGIVPQNQFPQGGAPPTGYKTVPASGAAAGEFYQPEKNTAMNQQSGPVEIMDSGSQPRYEMDGTAMQATRGQGRMMHEMPGSGA